MSVIRHPFGAVGVAPEPVAPHRLPVILGESAGIDALIDLAIADAADRERRRANRRWLAVQTLGFLVVVAFFGGLILVLERLS